MTPKQHACFFCSQRRSDERSRTTLQNRHPSSKRSASFSHLGSEPGIRCPGLFAFGPIGRKDGVSLVLFFLLSTFKYITGTVSAYLVYTLVLGMGISLSVFTRFRLLVWMTGDLVDLYPRVKERSECMGCGRRGRTGHTD